MGDLPERVGSGQGGENAFGPARHPRTEAETAEKHRASRKEPPVGAGEGTWCQPSSQRPCPSPQTDRVQAPVFSLEGSPSLKEPHSAPNEVSWIPLSSPPWDSCGSSDSAPHPGGWSSHSVFCRGSSSPTGQSCWDRRVKWTQGQVEGADRDLFGRCGGRRTPAAGLFADSSFHA